jgi:prepilin-type N-terminal cleavage/methylation domain-containing protein
MSRNTRRTGLTLIEVLIALVITATVVLIGRSGLEQLMSVSTTSRQAVETRLAARATADELRRTFRLASAPVDSADSFEGAARELILSTRCHNVRGWDEACRCSLQIVPLAQGAAVRRSCSSRMTADTLISDTESITFRYLISVRNGGEWLDAWGRSLSVPYAVGIVRRAARDTIILRVRNRG